MSSRRYIASCYDIKVIEFDLNTHLSLVNEWRLAYNLRLLSEDETAKLGYIATISGRPVAAVFLRMVEGGYGQIDGLIRDPKANRQKASDGLDRAVSRAIQKARELSLKGLMAYTMDNRTLERSYRHGWVKLDQTLIAIDLK